MRQLARELRGKLLRPGEAEYARATRPRNSLAVQRPAAVVVAAGPADISACLRWAQSAGLRVAVQATGHGAAGSLGPDVILLDTSGLTELEIDSDRRVARLGPGVLSRQLAEAAAAHGLIAPLGTAPDVGVVGYTLFGGVGWMTRAFGLASAALLSAELIDGRGERRRAAPDADVDALWALRGGGGAGIVTAIELQLFAVEEPWGGYALWPLRSADRVTSAWSALVASGDRDLGTVVSTLRAPYAPPSLAGRSAIYLGAASPCGARAEPALAELMAQLPPPAFSAFGRCDSAALAKIHLDPPVPVAALGDGRWLRSEARFRAREIIMAVQDGAEPALAEVELRHVAGPLAKVDGALVEPPGALLLHAVGAADSASGRESVETELRRVAARAAADDLGRSAASFRDGRPDAPEALSEGERDRLARTRARLDPGGGVKLPRSL